MNELKAVLRKHGELIMWQNVWEGGWVSELYFKNANCLNAKGDTLTESLEGVHDELRSLLWDACRKVEST